MFSLEKIKVAIIGLGRSGRNIHAKHLVTDDRYQIVAACDVLADRRERAKAEWNCDVYADYHELIKRGDIDLYINATHSDTHYCVTKDLLAAGKSVVSEKPAAKLPEEVEDLIQTAKKSGSKFFAFFQQSRNAPYFVKAKEIADSGVLGRIVFVRVAFDGFSRRWDWQTVQRKVAGNLYNTGPHPVDQALRFLNYNGMPTVFCHMDRANSFGDAEDFVKVLLKAPECPLVEIDISSCSAYPDTTYTIQGTCGSLKGTMAHLDWKYFDPKTAPKQELLITPMVDAENMPAYPAETLNWIEESWDVPAEQADLFKTISQKYYDLVYASLTTGAEFPIKPEQAVQQLKVICECHRQNPFPVKF